MQHKSWPDLCESLLTRLETSGADTTAERGESGEGGYIEAVSGAFQ